ncbi:hypothetical protein FDH62_gp29 [Arthrobacter phage Pumancara]|uniref:Uncharacterized protein n=1 Tax=Arthrobacter phage Pumancara TaxID=1772311 RepID=A0A0U4K9R7_9CAUD|nr:hypothetical protein FDH62_gp29 [Arthrobacter phage Pumancara]ALY09987.1 hypothetical protein PUMANCARA_29 [Arthrobacter phage Pumancara]
MERRNYNHPTSQRIPRKGKELKGGAKSIRFNTEYWDAFRRRKQEARVKLLQRQVRDHLRFLREDGGQQPVYVFFGSGKEAELWSREFMLALLEVGEVWKPRRQMIRARVERMRGHRARLVAVWSSDPMPTSEHRRQQEVDAMYEIEDLNRVNGYEVSRETASV